MASVSLRTAIQKITRVLAVFGLVTVVVTTTPLVLWWAKLLSGPFEDSRGETLIVLGGTVLDNETIGINSYWRDVYGVRAWREGGFRHVLVSGGPDPEGHVISLPMADFLVCHGVPRENVWLENRSTTTRENAVFARELLRDVPGQKVLLTSDYHMYRALRTFRKAGVEVLPRPCPDALRQGRDWRARWRVFLELVTETGKIVYYRARGWI